MKLWKRILGVTMMALSVVLAILCIGAIAGSWVLNNSVTNQVVQVLTGVESGLGVADEALSRIGTRVGTARDRVADLEATVETAGQNVAENPILLTALSERVDLGIAPAINDLRESVQLIRETAIGIQNAIEALNALPFVSLGARASQQESLQQLSQGVTALTEGVQEIRTGVREARAQAADQVVSTISRGTSRLDAGLETIETAAADYGAQISGLRTATLELKASLTFWLDAVSVIATLALLWLIFSQAAVFLLGLSIYRNENLFARWIDTGR
jgi:X-X-X-Leu-X-X-Gly heptad repeat protein